MPDLIAQGQEAEHRWRRSLPPRKPLIIGREGPWAVSWDRQISRSHVEVQWRHGRLQVRKLGGATNPVFVRGKPHDEFSMKPGEQFVIGATMFTVADEKVTIAAEERSPVTEQTYTPQFLQGLRFRNADERIAVLNRLPQIISDASSETELLVRLVSVLMSGIPRASAVAIVVAQRDSEATHEIDNVRVLQWDRRVLVEDDFRPSQRLIAQAIASGESVVHRFTQAAPENAEFTISEDVDWAFCTPISVPACRDWAIYVTGRESSDSTNEQQPDAHEGLQDDVKFTELVGGMLGSLRQLRRLERSHASLRQFLSPVVLQAVGDDADWEEVLAPRESDVTVLFCDLRGFSRESERHADDLWNLLARVSRALGVATRHVLDENGVVGDFHGDAVMGFWGWPLEQPDAIQRAAMTALAIRSDFEAAAHRTDHPLADFRIGIGIASGRAVAGKIGTADQVTVTVFGPVVNLASRLESMTKMINAPILTDGVTAAKIRKSLSENVARVRRVARVRPYGLDQALDVSELLPPESEMPQLSNDMIAKFENAAGAMFGWEQEVDWNKAFELLNDVPANDRAKDFLTVYMASLQRTPPENWDGAIALESK